VVFSLGIWPSFGQYKLVGVIGDRVRRTGCLILAAFRALVLMEAIIFSPISILLQVRLMACEVVGVAPRGRPDVRASVMVNMVRAMGLLRSPIMIRSSKTDGFPSMANPKRLARAVISFSPRTIAAICELIRLCGS